MWVALSTCARVVLHCFITWWWLLLQIESAGNRGHCTNRHLVCWIILYCPKFEIHSIHCSQKMAFLRHPAYKQDGSQDLIQAPQFIKMTQCLLFWGHFPIKNGCFVQTGCSHKKRFFVATVLTNAVTKDPQVEKDTLVAYISVKHCNLLIWALTLVLLFSFFIWHCLSLQSIALCCWFCCTFESFSHCHLFGSPLPAHQLIPLHICTFEHWRAFHIFTSLHLYIDCL